MRFILTTIIFTMFLPPAWASTPYTCFTEEVFGILKAEFVNPEVAPFKINVSDDGVNFVANSFFQNLSMGTKRFKGSRTVPSIFRAFCIHSF